MHKTWSRVLVVLLLVLLVLVAAWSIVATQIVAFSRQSSDGPADAALVLGAAAWGNRPSPVYRERILKAIALFKEHRVRWIVLTGGSPLQGYPSEAEVGRRYCVMHGVPQNALVVEDRSRTTWANLHDARRPMGLLSIRTVLVVSDPLHMKRAIAMARAQGMQARPAPTTTTRFRSWRTRATFLWHETWLYLGFVILGAHD